MIKILGDNIISSLGFTTEENLAAVREQRSGIVPAGEGFSPAEPFVASFIDRSVLDEKFAAIGARGKATALSSGYTAFEKAVILSADMAMEAAGIDGGSPGTAFVISTTKGNVELLGTRHPYEKDRVHLWRSAQVIAQWFGNPNEPFVISNACISGGSAQIVAARLIESGRYENAVVVGGDMISLFVVSGFQSFKALSPVVCRPFDAHRQGLNLGEGAASMVFGREDAPGKGDMMFVGGAIRNDANHISGPSRTGEGLFNAIRAVAEGYASEEFAFVNAHGTATPYNDEMESIALERAGFDRIPVNSLKGYFGHTLGAAGLVEGVISVRALHEGFIPVSPGYGQCGVSNPLDVVTAPRTTGKDKCLKMLSGFGGCNAALIYRVIR